MPEPTPQADGRVVYRLRLQDGLLYQDDPAFALGTPGATTRQVLAADVAFQLMRLADPKVNSPVAPTFARLVGFTAFTERLTALREADAAFARAPHRPAVCARPAASKGVRVLGPTELELVLDRAVPAAPLLAGDGVHHADPVGGGGLLRREGGARRLRGASRRHRAVPARASTTSGCAWCSRAIRTGTARSIPNGARPAPSIPPTASRTTPPTASSTRATSAGRCRCSIAWSSASTRRTSRRSRSSSRATTTRRASSRRASIASCTRGGCRRRCRRST